LAVLTTIPLVYPCGVHQYDDEKQFPEDNIVYNPANPEHRGWSQYLTPSLAKTRKLVLTFDDGPHPTNTPKLLDILKKYNVKATFFTVGEVLKKYPKIGKRIVEEGHILAGHDWRHTNSNSESAKQFAEGLTMSVKQVKKHYPNREMYYRFPYGAYGRHQKYHHFNVMKEVSQKLFSENCINFAFWDMDTSDWVSNMLPKDIFQTLKAHFDGGKAYRFKKTTVNGRTKYVKEPFTIKNPIAGGVVLMHDIHAKTVKGTEMFLEWAQTNNIEIVPINQVKEFEYRNKNCELSSLTPTF
jgi:peptidoglycan/xylan/chitin deacetylase (PgdA/CDA1 family)